LVYIIGVDYAFGKPVHFELGRFVWLIEDIKEHDFLLTDEDPSTCVDFDLRFRRYLSGRVAQIEEDFEFSFHVEYAVASQLELWIILSDRRQTHKISTHKFPKDPDSNWNFLFSNPYFTWNVVALGGNWIESNSTLRLCDIEITIHSKGMCKTYNETIVGKILKNAILFREKLQVRTSPAAHERILDVQFLKTRSQSA